MRTLLVSKKHVVFSLMAISIGWMACEKDVPTDVTDVHDHNSHEHHDDHHIDLTVTGFPTMPIPADNPTTEAGVDLGRHLFYDPAVGCRNCHDQSMAFASPINLDLEIEGGSYARSPMPLFNLGWVDKLAWDGRDTHGLEDKMTGSIEVSSSKQYDEVLADIQASSFDYASKYEAAFGDPTINQENTNKALAQFLRTIISSQSRGQRYIQGETSVLNAQEIEGYNIFKSETANCFHCHLQTNLLFTDNTVRNNGLDSVSSVMDFEDPGHYFATGIDFDRGKFRSVTLLNIELTAPYMHDGRFQTLEEVVEHYNSGGKFAPNLDNVMNENPDQQGLGLTDSQKAALVAFLKTLTDSTLINDTTLSNPF